MKNLINKLFLVAAFAVVLASCKPELAVPTASKGNLNLTSYVAMGNSLTSGFQNGGLFYAGQQSSYANVLATQFKIVEPSLVFNTPYVEANSVGYGQPTPTLTGSGLSASLTIKVPAPLSLQMLPNCKGVTGLTPAPIQAHGDPSLLGTDSLGPIAMGTLALDGVLGSGATTAGPLPASIYKNGNGTAGPGPYHNMGVPGARCIDVNSKTFGGSNLIQSVSTSGSAVQSNPFFSRFVSSQGNASMLSDAMIMKPTFFTLFIGNNDVLLWASAGGVTTTGSTPITPAIPFNASFDTIVNTLMTTAEQGVVINIAQITGAAFFTTIQPDTSKYIVNDSSNTRKMHENDMFLLTVPQDSLNCSLKNSQGYEFGSVNYPIPKKYTLTAHQVDSATNAINGYNAHMESVANAKGLAFFDMNAFTKANQSGVTYNGMGLTGAFVTGGIFSLDGLHLTPRGYALLTNGIIQTINGQYKSSIPLVDITKLNGVTFPQ